MPEIATKPTLTAYVLYYREGNNPHSLQKFFHLPTADMKIVVERVKKHCELTRLRFVNVRPFWSDLDRDESVLLS